MFDFRYHALSLMAVFIALAVGLLLGVAIGDEELVSSAKDDIRDSLRGDVRKANGDREEARDALARQNEFVDEAYRILAGGRLPEKRVGVVVLGPNEPDTVRDVRRALEPTGADIELVAVVDRRIDRSQLARRATGTRYEDLGRGTDADLLEGLGRRVGVQMVTGGRLITVVRPALVSSLSGGFGALDEIVVVRTATPKPEQPKPGDEQAAKDADSLQDGIAAGLVEAGDGAVGVERQDTDESQIGWYRDHGLSSVDNVDEQAGRAALVYVLAGAEGSYGRRESAESLLPAVSPDPRNARTTTGP